MQPLGSHHLAPKFCSTLKKAEDIMSGRPKIEITQSVELLKELMKKQNRTLEYCKVLALYLLKSEREKTVRGVAQSLGKGEATIHRWLSQYKTGGIENLLLNRQTIGRPKKIPVETVAKIQQELRDTEGFSSYKEIKIWLELLQDITCSYGVVYNLVKSELKSKFKIPRPKSVEQKHDAVNQWKNNLTNRLKYLLSGEQRKVKKYQKVSFWCSDETRIGLHTISRRKITLSGVKPEGKKQMVYKSFWLYGAVEPKSGRSFFFEFSHLDTVCFENFLELFSQSYPDELLIIQVDNAPSHISLELEIPDNIILLFQPPYSREVNPIERFWEYVKDIIANNIFVNLEELIIKVETILASLTNKNVGFLTGWSWIIHALAFP